MNSRISNIIASLISAQDIIRYWQARVALLCGSRADMGARAGPGCAGLAVFK